MIKELTISGFRGFAKAQTICFALPQQGKRGSGLTIITGANNSGKTTIIESIRAFIGNNVPSFSEGKRNAMQKGKVRLCLKENDGKEHVIETVQQGGRPSAL